MNRNRRHSRIIQENDDDCEISQQHSQSQSSPNLSINSIESSYVFKIENELSDMKKFLEMSIKGALIAGPDLSESGNYSNAERVGVTLKDLLRLERKVGKEIGIYQEFEKLMRRSDLNEEIQVLESVKKFQEESSREESIRWGDDPIFKEFHELNWECGPGHGNKNKYPEIENDNVTGEIFNDNDNNNDNVVIQTRESLMCPLSKGLLINPVKSSTCNHSFSKLSILALMAQTHTETISCPVPGCRATISKGALRGDERLERKLKRIGERIFS